MRKHLPKITAISGLLVVFSIVVVFINFSRSNAPVFTLSLFPGAESLTEGVISTGIDRSIFTQFIDIKKLLSLNENNYRWYSISNIPTTVSIFIYDISADETLVIRNRIPIKVLSYQSVPNTVDVLGETINKERPCCLFEVEISPESINQPDQNVWAYLTPLETYIALGITSADPIYDTLPTEIQRLFLGELSSYPDQIKIENHRQVLIDITMLFSGPGVYTLQPGIEYVYKGKTNIAWADPPFTIFVPDKYYSWKRLTTNYGQDKYYLNAICEFTEGHICRDVCTFSNNGVDCK